MNEQSPRPGDFRSLLHERHSGDEYTVNRMMAAVYPALRKIAARFLRNDRRGHTLQATELVHELYLRLFANSPILGRDRAVFLGVCARQLRQILVDHARRRNAQKRGGDVIKLSLTEVNGIASPRIENVLDVDRALLRLEELDPRAATIVELRFFGGLQDNDIAEVLGISLATLHRDWRFARAWLSSEFLKVP